ncbi:MAG: hypothetical protein ACYC7C_05160 [Coriobacteriia bacterium]
MSIRGSLHHRYPVLGPLERVRLVLAALDRGDSHEAELLVTTTPRVNVRITDPEFMSLIAATQSVAYLYALLAGSAEAHRAASDVADTAIQLSAIRYEHGFELGVLASGVPEKEHGVWGVLQEQVHLHDEIRQELEDSREGDAQVLVAATQALERLCEEEGLEIDELLAWYPPARQQVATAFELSEEPDEAVVEQLYAVFRRQWDAWRL